MRDVLRARVQADRAAKQFNDLVTKFSKVQGTQQDLRVGAAFQVVNGVGYAYTDQSIASLLIGYLPGCYDRDLCKLPQEATITANVEKGFDGNWCPDDFTIGIPSHMLSLTPESSRFVRLVNKQKQYSVKRDGDRLKFDQGKLSVIVFAPKDKIEKGS